MGEQKRLFIVEIYNTEKGDSSFIIFEWIFQLISERGENSGFQQPDSYAGS